MREDRSEWDRLEGLLDALLDLPEPDRPAFIADVERRDPADARVLRDWLRGIEQSAGYLSPRSSPRPGFSAGELIGNWRLLRLLGRGGMGEVWLGERADGLFAKQVAVKVIRDERPQLARHIESERRLLAPLQHPGIVRLLDAGTTADGHPFLVTDYIDGVTLDLWRRQRRPSLERRLEVFGQVVRAVAHAHEHLVVHRDIKPGNVLVGRDGRAHLLDFGIASALGGEQTAGGLVALTPEFAAPESVTGRDVSVRTDVHALGGLLYFLICGEPPLALRGLPMADVEQALRERTPLPPSRRLSAGDRKAAPRRLLADLDAIALKALAKAPQERHGSAEALLADVEAARENRPVSARPADTWDRLGRLWTRNSTPITAAALLLVSLVVGLIGTLWQAYEARLQRDRAEAEAVRANAEAQAAMRVRNFLVDVYRSADPSRGGSSAPTARDLVDAGVRRIDRELAAHPVLQAQLLDAMAQTYSGLGENRLAEDTMRRARGLAVAALGEPSLLAARLSVGLAQVVTGGSAELHGDEIVPMLQRIVAQESVRQAPDVMVAALDQLGLMQQSLDDPAGGIANLQRAVEVGRRAAPAADAELSEALSHLSLAHSRGNRIPEATDAMRESLDIQLRLSGPDSVATATSQIGLAQLLARTGHVDEAETLIAAGVKTYRAAFGENHNQYAWSLRRLALLRLQLGREEGVEAMLLESLAIAERSQGEDSVDVSESLNALAALKTRQMRIDEAIGYQEKVVAFCHRVYGADSAATLGVTRGLAGLHARNGAFRQAEATLKDVLAAQRRQESTDTASTLYWIGNARRLQDDAEAARRFHQEALDEAVALMGEQHDFVYRLHIALGEDARNLGDLAGARRHALTARDGLRALLGDESSDPVRDAGFLLAEIDALDGQCGRALPLLEGMRERRGRFSDGPYARWLTAEAGFFAGQCRATGGDDQGRALWTESARTLAASPLADPYLRRLAQAALGNAAAPAR